MKKNDVVLYNGFFPTWLFIWIMPESWLFMIPANTLLDGLVIYFGLKRLGHDNLWKKTKTFLLKTVIFGFLSDIIASLAMFAFLDVFDKLLGEEYYDWLSKNVFDPVLKNPFASILGFLYVAFFIFLAGCLIYVFNKKFNFTKEYMEEKDAKKLALYMAFITAPYAFLIPLDMFFEIIVFVKSIFY